jgi:phosphinothricin acetyltransferase
MPELSIRPVRRSDVSAITRIYNVSVLQSTATFQTTPDTEAHRLAWLKSHGGRHPAFVAVLDGAVVGWSSLTPYSLREAWRCTVEDSIYLDASVQGRGYGTVLLRHLLDEARRLDHRIVLARIEAGHAASIALHAKLGFIETGRLLRVGWKFGRWHDVSYMQRDLYEGAEVPPPAGIF